MRRCTRSLASYWGTCHGCMSQCKNILFSNACLACNCAVERHPLAKILSLQSASVALCHMQQHSNATWLHWRNPTWGPSRGTWLKDKDPGESAGWEPNVPVSVDPIQPDFFVLFLRRLRRTSIPARSCCLITYQCCHFHSSWLSPAVVPINSFLSEDSNSSYRHRPSHFEHQPSGSRRPFVSLAAVNLRLDLRLFWQSLIIALNPRSSNRLTTSGLSISAWQHVFGRQSCCEQINADLINETDGRASKRRQWCFVGLIDGTGKFKDYIFH